MSRAERFLITGAFGCIGAWILRQLLAEGADVVALDAGDDRHRLELLLSPQQLGALRTVWADVTDLSRLEATLDDHGITNVIHLAALQVPACRRDPALGARVNVVGTINVLHAVARRRSTMAPVVYASSIAAQAIADDGPKDAASPSAAPATLYGVFKRANEDAAAVFWTDCGLASVGLRPHTVYGVGRDEGLTSAPTLAMLAAAAGKPYRISYGGRSQLQYAPDVARAFIAASRARPAGASAHDLGGASVSMAEVVAAIEAVVPSAAGTISHGPEGLPFPSESDGASLSLLVGELRETRFAEGVAQTIAEFRRLLELGRLREA